MRVLADVFLRPRVGPELAFAMSPRRVFGGIENENPPSVSGGGISYLICNIYTRVLVRSMGVWVVCWVLFWNACYVALIVVVLGIICSESVI